MSARWTESQLAMYERDGYVVIRQFFEAAELEPLLNAYRKDPTVNGSLYGMVDIAGAPHPICIWTELADDIIGMIPRMARLVEGTEMFLGEPCYHWHSKLTVKPPGCRARIDWHQDYASWYDDGVLFPRMLTVGIAIEPATRANGCLQLIPGSHQMGRIDHLDLRSLEVRCEKAQEIAGLVHCEMDSGDAVFFHCNTLHGSASNETETSRLMLFASYNAASNEPIPDAQGKNEEGAFMNITPEERRFSPIEKVPDDVLLTHQYLSAFNHTPFKQPVTALDDGFCQAVELK